MNTNEPIFTSRRITCTSRMDGNPDWNKTKWTSLLRKIVLSILEKEAKKTQRIDRSEMTFDSSNLLFKHFMPESSLKLSLTQRCRRNTHCFLTTTKQHLELEMSFKTHMI